MNIGFAGETFILVYKDGLSYEGTESDPSRDTVNSRILKHLGNPNLQIISLSLYKGEKKEVHLYIETFVYGW